MKDLLVDRIKNKIYNMFVWKLIQYDAYILNRSVFFFFFWMQLGLHSDRMTVETKNYNVETKNKYLYTYLHRVWLFRLICHQYYIWKKLISKKTYQLCKTKGCEHRFRKVCRGFFWYFLFFSHIVIFLRKSKSRKFTYFHLFALSSPVRTPRGLCRALEKLG